MRLELKKAIINWMIEHINTFSLVNNTVENFREYIYNSKGEHLIGGEDVYNFIKDFYKLLTSNNL